MNPMRESWFGLSRVLISVVAGVGLPTWMLATALIYKPPLTPSTPEQLDPFAEEHAPSILPSLFGAALRGLLVTAAVSPIPVALLGVAALASKLPRRKRAYDLPPDAVVLRGVQVKSHTEVSWNPGADEPEAKKPS